MQEELKLNVGARYVSDFDLLFVLWLIFQSIVLLVFFIPYVIVQFPSSVVDHKVSARTFLAGITFAWGVVMIVGLPPLKSGIWSNLTAAGIWIRSRLEGNVRTARYLGNI